MAYFRQWDKSTDFHLISFHPSVTSIHNHSNMRQKAADSLLSHIWCCLSAHSLRQHPSEQFSSLAGVCVAAGSETLSHSDFNWCKITPSIHYYIQFQILYMQQWSLGTQMQHEKVPLGLGSISVLRYTSVFRNPESQKYRLRVNLEFTRSTWRQHVLLTTMWITIAEWRWRHFH